MVVPARLAPWLVLASTLVWLPGGFSRFVLPKLALACLAVLVGALGPAHGRLPRGVVAIASGGLLVAAVAALLGPAPLAALAGRWPRYEGLPLMLVYLGCAWAGARTTGTSGGITRRFTAPAATAALLLGLTSVLDAAGVGPTSATAGTRDGSVLGNATDQGVVAAMLVAVLVASPGWVRRPLEVAGVLAAVVALGLSGSRASMLSLLLVLAAVALARRRELLRPLAMVGAAVVVTALAVPASRDRLLEGYTVGTRLVQWRETIALVRDHPFLGVGPSGYLDAIGRYETAADVRRTGVAEVADSAHSWPLQALTAGGVPLLLLALALALVLLRLGWARVRADPSSLGLLAAVAVFGLALLVNFTTAGTTCLAAFLVGALVAEAPPVTERRTVPRLAAVAAGALVVVLVVACVGEVVTQRGVDAARRGSVSDATGSFDSAVDLRPWDPDTAMIAAQALAGPASDGSAQAADAAAGFARRSLARTPASCASGLALGVARIGQGRLREAVTALDRVVERCPRRPAAYVQRGIARFGLRDVSGARRDLREALRLAPRDPEPHRILRVIRQRVG